MTASRHSAGQSTVERPSGPDDPTDAFRRYRQTGDVELRNELVVCHTWLADRCARRFANRGEPLADLRQVANVGLVKAVERFDPDREVAFASFAVPTITGEIKRHFRDRCWAVSASRTTKDRRSAVQRAIEHLEQTLGRVPTVEEIAETTGDDVERVDEVLVANRAYRTSPLDRSGADPAFGSDDSQVATVMAHRALESLDDRSRRILYLRFFEDRTQREIGERIGVCQVQVSRLIRSALAELRERIATGTASPAPPRSGHAPHSDV